MKARVKESGLAGLAEVEYVTFYIGDVLLGVEIFSVDEINRNVDHTPVPHAPRFVRGVLNLRGEVVTVVDLRMILDLPPTEPSRDARTVIVRSRGEQIGLHVDRVADVVTTTLDGLEPPPANTKGVDSRFLKGIFKSERELLVILDVEACLDDSAPNQ